MENENGYHDITVPLLMTAAWALFVVLTAVWYVGGLATVLVLAAGADFAMRRYAAFRGESPSDQQ